MPRISRIVAVDYPHHITQSGVRSMGIFHSEHDDLSPERLRLKKNRNK